MSQIRHEPVAPTHSLAFSSGDVIDRHRHDDDQLIYVATGVLAITTEHGSWVASPQRAVLVPAGVGHEHRFFGATSFHTVGFPSGTARHDRPAVLDATGLVRELVVAATEAALSPAERSRLLAVLRDRLRRVAERPLRLPAARDPRLAETCRLVQADLSRPRSMTWLAARSGASERTLARLFRDEFGTTYPQWRTQARVFAALVELARGATVTEAGRACGWATTSAFVDAFGRTMGATPGEYLVQRRETASS